MECRETERRQHPGQDVGALFVHRSRASAVAPKRKVFVFDGDGALWMNLGSLATIALHQPKNLIHICWDNQQYESSGGEPTVSTAGNIEFAGIARSAGIKSSRRVSTVDELKEAVSHALSHDGPHFIWARIEAARTEAPPLRYDELENKYRFIRYVEETEGSISLRSAARQLPAQIVRESLILGGRPRSQCAETKGLGHEDEKTVVLGRGGSRLRRAFVAATVGLNGQQHGQQSASTTTTSAAWLPAPRTRGRRLGDRGDH